MNIKALRLIFVLVFFLLAFSTTYAQKQTLTGLNVNMNLYPDQISLNALNIGATFETQLGRHSGGETGLFYRTYRITNIASYSDASGSHSYFFTLTRRYLTVPLLYKYYSNRINFSAGPAFDFLLSGKQKKDEFPSQIPFPYQVLSYPFSPKVKIGFLTKVSKTIPVNKQFIIEPEIRFGSVRTLDQANVGIGIAGKYRF